MKPIVRVLVVSLIGAGLIVAGATQSAWACSCAGAGDAEYFESAEVVFTGVVVERTSHPPEGPYGSSGDPIDFTVDVESMLKGRVDDPAVVRTAVSGASCGFSFEVGKRYQIFGEREGDVVHASLCSGTRVLEPGSMRCPATRDGRAEPPCWRDFR